MLGLIAREEKIDWVVIWADDEEGGVEEGFI